MYLSLLNEEEKELFISLAVNLASADGNFCEQEKIMIDAYCQEMSFTYNYDKAVVASQIIINRLTAISNLRNKKIMVFEAVGLAMADNYFHENERKIINEMVDKFKLDTDYVSKCEDVIREYAEFQNKINKLVIGQ